MKILFLKEKRSDSGIEGISSYLFNVCKELNRLKVDYLVLYNSEDLFYKKMVENNIKVKIIEFLPPSAKNMFHKYKDVLKLRNKVYQIVKNEKITLISVHFPHLLGYVDKSWGIPIVAHWHGAFIENKPLKSFYIKDILNPKQLLKSFYQKHFAFNFSKADIVICPSEAAKNTAEFKYKVNKNKLKIIPNGIPKINTNLYNSLRQELGFLNTDKIIISVGRETKSKGVEDFCKVALSFQDKTEYKFLFFGGYRDEKYHNYLVNKYGEVVKFMGMKENINDYYKTADLFLFLSHRESQGNVLLEALSFKLPCICWDIIGVNEVIENNKNGFLCKFGDILDICSKIELVFSSNYKLNFDYKFNKKFLLEESVKTTIKIYESL